MQFEMMFDFVTGICAMEVDIICSVAPVFEGHFGRAAAACPMVVICPGNWIFIPEDIAISLSLGIDSESTEPIVWLTIF